MVSVESSEKYSFQESFQSVERMILSPIEQENPKKEKNNLFLDWNLPLVRLLCLESPASEEFD